MVLMLACASSPDHSSMPLHISLHLFLLQEILGAMQAGVKFVVFSTLEDLPEDVKSALPRLEDGYTVPHFEAKANVQVRAPNTVSINGIIKARGHQMVLLSLHASCTQNSILLCR